MNNKPDPRPSAIIRAQRLVALGLLETPADDHPGWQRLLDDLADRRDFEGQPPRFDEDFGA
jgi:hypothetical protein